MSLVLFVDVQVVIGKLLLLPLELVQSLVKSLVGLFQFVLKSKVETLPKTLVEG
jgi:hypothetical protein